MNANEIIEQLNGVFAEVLDDDTISLTPELGPDDIEGWDSLSQIELLMGIEDQFGAKIPIEDAMNIHSVADIINAIQSKLA